MERASEVMKLVSSDEGSMQFVENMTKNAKKIQDEVLELILEENNGVDYFRRHQFDASMGKSGFKKFIPIITYQDIEQDFQRIALENDPHAANTLCNQAVHELNTSSGTSGGKRKIFLKSTSFNAEFAVLCRIARAALNKSAGKSLMGKSMQFIYIRKPMVTRGGLIASTGLSGYYTSSAFKNRTIDPMNAFTSPDEVILCVDYAQSSYCHLLCGLIRSSEVTRLGAVFASAFIRSIKALRDHWKQLCQDIRTGKLSEIVSDLAVRDSVEKILKPNPQLANAVARECSSGCWRGIVRRLWPNAKLIETIVTGSMQQYVATVDFLTDKLPIASCIYAASECACLGANLHPFSSQKLYTFVPTFAYYEFLPLQRTSSSAFLLEVSEIVSLTEVELGKEYELVVTTFAGLYRYRVGDVLRVVKFHNNSPQFAVICRSGVLLSIDTDKTDEQELHQAVTKAARSLGSCHRLFDYTSRVELSSDPPCYVIYWEIASDDDIDDPVSMFELEECARIIEESLSDIYHRNRQEGIIGPIQLKLVGMGAFDAIMDHATEHGNASLAQYKTPRCVKSLGIIRILEQFAIRVASPNKFAFRMQLGYSNNN